MFHLLTKDELYKRRPPSPSYVRRVLEVLMSKVEEFDDALAEILTELLIAGPPSASTPFHFSETAALPAAKLSELVSLGPYVSSGWSLKSYWLTQDQEPAAAAALPPLTLHLAADLFSGSTGCHEWEAGFVLAELLLNRPEIVRGKHVLELGCGCGLTGAVLSSLPTCSAEASGSGRRCASALLTDGDASALLNSSLNLKLAGIDPEFVTSAPASGTVGLMAMRWEDPPPAWLQPDVILAADVLYDPTVIPALVGLLYELLTRRPIASSTIGGDVPETCSPSPRAESDDSIIAIDSAPTAVIVTTLRQEATLQLFLAEARGRGIRVAEERGAASGFNIRFEPHLALSAAGARERIFVHTLSV